LYPTKNTKVEIKMNDTKFYYLNQNNKLLVNMLKPF
jgi:hypothetical protein